MLPKDFEGKEVTIAWGSHPEECHEIRIKIRAATDKYIVLEPLCLTKDIYLIPWTAIKHIKLSPVTKT